MRTERFTGSPEKPKLKRTRCGTGHQASGSVLQAAKDISSILAGEKTKKHAQLGDPNMRAAMALAINPVLSLLFFTTLEPRVG